MNKCEMCGDYGKTKCTPYANCLNIPLTAEINMKKRIDLSEITDIQFEGIDHNDAPDYCDTYIVSAKYKGEHLTEEELEELNESNSEFVHEKLMDYLN